MSTELPNNPRSSSEQYYRELYEEIRSGRRTDPDLWLNPDTGKVELRPGRKRAK